MSGLFTVNSRVFIRVVSRAPGKSDHTGPGSSVRGIAAVYSSCFRHPFSLTLIRQPGNIRVDFRGVNDGWLPCVRGGRRGGSAGQRLWRQVEFAFPVKDVKGPFQVVVGVIRLGNGEASVAAALPAPLLVVGHRRLSENRLPYCGGSKLV
ncbi:MAG: hypothetical protein ACPG5T_02460 [Endozoicomonas sp.]